MSWPTSQDFNEAIQNPRLNLQDPELRFGEPALSKLGMPIVMSGTFADVYKIHCVHTGHDWAVKCFTRQVPDQQDRYRKISDHLKQSQLPFTVGFHYLPEGIRVRGQWFPIVKMHWVEGVSLNAFVGDNLRKPQTLETLAQLWAKLAQRLRDADLAHADLQHGNVLLVSDGTGGLKLKLIDYDGMFVPALGGKMSGECGHSNYQHPLRLKHGFFNAGVDRFPHLVVGCALRALTVGGQALWDRYDNGDNLLFKQKDFEAPQDSALLRELWRSPDALTKCLAGHLIRSTGLPVGQEPFWPDLVGSNPPPALSAADERAVQAVLNRAGTRPATTPPPVRQTAATGKASPAWIGPASIASSRLIAVAPPTVQPANPAPPNVDIAWKWLLAESAAFRAWLWGMVKTILKVTFELLKQCVPVVQRLWGMAKTILKATFELLKQYVPVVQRLWGVVKTILKASVAPIPWAYRRVVDVLSFLSSGDSYSFRIAVTVIGFMFILASILTFNLLSVFGMFDAPAAVTDVQQSAVPSVGQLNPPVTVAPEPIPDPFPDPIPQPQALVVSPPEGPLESPSNSLIGKQSGDSQEVTLPGGVKLKLVWCPPGTFTMGTPGATDDEAPVQVTLTKGYWLAATETTQGQYTSVMGTTPWVEHGDTDYYKAGANFPASYITHIEAEAYCAKLTEIDRKAGRLPTGWKYALPTEAQWEYACRAGTKTKYSCGDDESQLGNYAWFDKNASDIGEKYAHTVGTKLANPWGLYDMHGNVWEWCRDEHAGKLLGGSDPVNTSVNDRRVLRGGSWNYYATYSRSADRTWYSPGLRVFNYGFRVVRTQ